MGLEAEVLRHNTTEKGTRFIDPQGRPFAPFPVKKGVQATFTSEWEILRADLASVLYDATKDKAGIKYVFGTFVKDVLSNDEKSVKVELSDGRVEEYDVLVAADGQWSKIRKMCFPQEDITVVDKNMYVAYFTVPREAQDDDWWSVYQGLNSKIITLRPDPYNTIRAMFSMMPCNEAQRQEWKIAGRSDRKTQQELVRREFQDAGWQAQRLLDAMDSAPDFYFQTIQQIKMKTWSASRVVCLGDAAYAPSPLTGMGTSLAINGAYILAGELSQLEKGQHPQKALQAYEDKYRKFVEETQEIPSFVPAIAHPQTAFKRRIFAIVISLLAKALSTQWIASRIAPDAEQEDFPLPQYASVVEKA